MSPFIRLGRVTVALAVAIVAVSCTENGAFDLFAEIDSARIPEDPDPQQITLAATADTDIDEDSATTNYGAELELTANLAGGSLLGKRRVLVRFDLAAIPSGAVISSAAFVLTKTGGDDTEKLFDVYSTTSPWVEMEATWLNSDSGTLWPAGPGSGEYASGEQLLATVSMTGSGEYRWEGSLVTALVQDWSDGIVENNGFIMGSAETSTTDRFFASRTYGVAASRPRLEVVYTIP